MVLCNLTLSTIDAPLEKVTSSTKKYYPTVINFKKEKGNKRGERNVFGAFFAILGDMKFYGSNKFMNT